MVYEPENPIPSAPPPSYKDVMSGNEEPPPYHSQIFEPESIQIESERLDGGDFKIWRYFILLCCPLLILFACCKICCIACCGEEGKVKNKVGDTLDNDVVLSVGDGGDSRDVSITS